MNVNLFMGLNAKKTCHLNKIGLQISKPACNNKLTCDKFREIMSDIKKNDLTENIMMKKKTFDKKEVTHSNSGTAAEEILDNKELYESNKTDKNDSKSLSLKQLKKIDERLYDFISFLILSNLPAGQKPGNITIEVKEGQVIASGKEGDFLINSSVFDSIAKNIAGSLEQTINGIIAAGNKESAGPGANMNVKDAFTKAIIDALNQAARNAVLPSGETSSEDLAIAQKPNTASLAEATGTKNFISGIQSGEVIQTRDSMAVPVTDAMVSDLKKDGRVVSLQQSLGRLFKQLGLPADLVNKGIESIVESLETPSQELELARKDLLNLAKKITVELSQLSKKLALSLEELVSSLEPGNAGKLELSSHLAKSLRNSEVFEYYSDKFLKPFVFQPGQGQGISNIGEVSANNVTAGETVNLADVITQISSKIQISNNPVVSQLEILLKPESLGAIRIKIEAQGDGVNIKIQTQYSHTEEIISSNLDMLKNNLSEKGVLLKDLSVFMDLGTANGSNPGQGFSGFGNALDQSNSSKHQSPENLLSKNSASEDSGKEVLTEDGIDSLASENVSTYGVDILA